MTTTQIILIVAIVAVIALLAARGGGPRVTHIDTRREKEDRKDDDA
jgi:hypothetical protein